MRKILRLLLIVLIIFIVAVAVFTVSVYMKYSRVESLNLKPELLNTKVLDLGRKTLGSSVTLDYQIKCPWNKKPASSEVFPGKGTHEIEKPEFVKTNTGWGYNVWNVMYTIQPYLTGDIPEGKIELTFSPDINGKADKIILKIPTFISTALADGKDKLSIAGKVNADEETLNSRYGYIWLIIVAVLMALFLIYWFILRKPRDKELKIQPWIFALCSLKELNEDFHSGKLNAVKCISSLTYIVRDYLEDRFNIHAPRQTTEEFLRNMESGNSPLNHQNRNFLQEFMTSADMVKFAKYEASNSEVESAINRAEQLINETIPDESVNDIG